MMMKRRVCVHCRDEARLQQDGLVEKLLSGSLLMAERLPPPKTTVILTDSDSDPSDNGLESESEFEFEEEDALEDVIAKITVELGLDRQISEGRRHLEDRFKNIEQGFESLNSEYNKIESQLDTIRKDFYDRFRPEIVWQPALDIGPSSIVIQQDGSEVIAETPVYMPNENLPPVGQLERWELQPNELVYSMKYSMYARWVQAQVIEVEKRDAKGTMYKIRYNRNTKSAGLPKVMTGRNLAYINPCATRIPVSTRVIAKYRDDDPKNNTISGSFYVGIVAEVPTAANKYRYLIFFDDGYAQYVQHHDIRVVAEASQCPWEDVSCDAREFIREYLRTYPERPMVRLQKWNYVRTEWNGQWWKAQVKEVDGSLVKMFFPMDGRSEWIYRGSFRLSPLFNKKLNIQAQAEQPLRTIRRRTAALPGRQGAVVEYVTHGQGQDGEGTETSSEGQGERRAVARKSTSSRAGTPPREILIKVEQESRGSFSNYSSNDKMVEYKAHSVCTHACLSEGDSMDKNKNVSPLLYPIVYGWQRQVCKQRKKSITKHDVYYVAPCGRRLRSIEEVFMYLSVTESALEIDCFTFEVAVDVSSTWEPFRKLFYTEDITKGDENVPISSVNSLDSAEPQELMYCNVRIPTEHVPLNLDPGYLVCCDCVDDCQDKSKCACWQLTIQNTAVLEKTINTKAGYEHRRLYEQVRTGIYECYARCKCSSHCVNRVVQQPLRSNLQLFKTARRGWGVRTLHDIPRGGFICVYVGRMLNEAIANEEGKITGGDDYYAELDYIEVVEHAKDDYEDEPLDPELDDSSKTDDNDSNKDSSGSLAKLLSRALRRTGSNGGSESNDSDSLYSENEPDNNTEDQDFDQPSGMRRAGRGLAKREKSARIMERAAKRSKLALAEGNGSGSGSAVASDEESKKENNGEGESKQETNDVETTKENANEEESKKENNEEESKKENNDEEKSKKINDDKMETEEEKSIEGDGEDKKKDENEEEDDDDDDGEEEADNKQRQRQMFGPSQLLASQSSSKPRYKTHRSYYGEDEAVYIMDAKHTGNIGRFLNHSCDPNAFVQNVFVDTHDMRFPWVSFFAKCNIRAGTELTWDYNYEVDSVPGRIKYCYCGASKCRGRLL